MDFGNAVLCVLITTLAASYAWGMRGALIGGEKGAMLPGAFIGLCLAWFSGGGIRENIFTVAAAGLMGMTFGGTEPYGETMGFVLHRGRPDYNPVKGYFGLAFKGALWFTICAGFISVSMVTLGASVYSSADIIIFCLLIRVAAFLGYKLFNTPYDKEKGIYPRIFYSLTRREEWGSNLLLLIMMMAMAVIRGDSLTLAMIFAGFVFGAVGWCVAIKAYETVIFPLKNGKYLFGRLYHNNLIDGWKLMEFILGAFGGFGISLTFCVKYDEIQLINSDIAASQRGHNENVELILSAVCVACVIGVLIVNLYQYICERKDKETDSFFWDKIERTLYSVVPMLLVLLGSYITAEIMTVFMLFYVCVLKCIFERFKESRFIIPIQAVSLTACAAVLALCFCGVFRPYHIIIAGTVPYLAAELIHTIWTNKRKGISIGNTFGKTSFATVYPTFFVMSAVLLVGFYKIFAV